MSAVQKRKRGWTRNRKLHCLTKAFYKNEVIYEPKQGWDLTAKIPNHGLRLIACHDRGLTG